MTLIGYWPLNETEGDTAYDYSGNENHGGLEGNPTQGANGVVGGNAYEFDGSNDYVDLGEESQSAHSFPHETGICTVTAWAKMESGNGGWKHIVGPTNSSTDSDMLGWALFPHQDNELMSFRIVAHDTNQLIVEDNFSPNDWHFFVATCNGKTGRLYIDGVEKATDSFSSTGSGDSTFNTEIGRQARAEDNHFPGKIQEIRLYNRALTPAEVQYLYNVGRRGRFMSRKKSP